MHFTDYLLFSNSISLLCQKCSKFGNFQNGKNGIFFWRQSILREAQAKKKYIFQQQNCATMSSVKKIQLEYFYKKKTNPKVGRDNVFSRFHKPPEIGLVKFVGVCVCFSKTCQKSPNCRNFFSRPVMNSPGIGQLPPGIYMKKNKISIGML